MGLRCLERQQIPAYRGFTGNEVSARIFAVSIIGDGPSAAGAHYQQETISDKDTQGNQYYPGRSGICAFRMALYHHPRFAPLT